VRAMQRPQRCAGQSSRHLRPLRCHILAGLAAFVASGAMTQAEADEWLAAITASRVAQIAKYRRGKIEPISL
jgi:hypothetical protein